MTMAREPPAHWQSRPDTWDRDIFDCVAGEPNEYHLPADLAAWTIVDVGAHVGAFAYACLVRGCPLVLAYESDPANYQVLAHNLGPWIRQGLAVAVNAAVWRSDGVTAKLRQRRCEVPANTGGGGVCSGRGEVEVPVIAGDEVLARALASRRKVLFKLDCEGSEWPILLTSELLPRVAYVLGEYHEMPQIPETARLPGYTRYRVNDLLTVLAAAGFNVRTHQDSDFLGHFWAGRD